MKIGVLALQGAFAEHEKVLEQLGAKCIELRQARDLGAGRRKYRSGKAFKRAWHVRYHEKPD